jgi:hypothetical protein
MELDEARQRVSFIHRNIVRGQFLHGYRAVPTFLSGLMAFVACSVQGIWLADDPNACLILWLSAAAVSVAIVAVEMLIRYRRADSSLERDMIIGAAEQFVPTLAAGGLVTLVLWLFDDSQLWLLPGFWAVMLSMAIFASRRMLPGAATLVGVHYLWTGLVCFAFAHQDKDTFFPAWTMATTFGAGQFLAAAVLYWSLERKPHSENRKC